MLKNNHEDGSIIGIHRDRSIQIAVIKQAQNVSIDANKLAELEQQRSMREQLQKKQKINDFLNNTRINASKIQRENQQENIKNHKKITLEKQKNIKAKYTVIKKQQQIKKINVQPMKIDWKPAENANKKLNIVQYCENICEQSDQSGIDSECQIQKGTNPQELIKFRENIRKNMLKKNLK